MNEYQSNHYYSEVDGDILPPEVVEWEDMGNDPASEHEILDQPYTINRAVSIEQTGPPIAITLRDRALALQAIAAYYNQASKRRGAENSRHASDFNNRYGREADDVVKGMAQKENRLLEDMNMALITLNASEALKANGESPESIGYTKRKLREQADREFGSRGVYATDRGRIVRRAEKLADAVEKGTSRNKSTKSPFAKYRHVLGSSKKD